MIRSHLDPGRFVTPKEDTVILCQLVMRVFGGMAQKVAVFVNRAALDRQGLAPECDEGGFQPGCAINKDELRPFQTACVEIAEEHAPCSFALAAHIHDGKQHLLTIQAHPDRR